MPFLILQVNFHTSNDFCDWRPLNANKIEHVPCAGISPDLKRITKKIAENFAIHVKSIHKKGINKSESLSKKPENFWKNALAELK